MITNAQAGTRVDEVANGIYRINTPSTKLGPTWCTTWPREPAARLPNGCTT